MDAAGSLMSASTNDLGRLFYHEEEPRAVVAAFARNSDPNWLITQCVFAGTFGPSISSFIENMRSADERAGVTQASPGLDIFTLRSQQQDADTQKTIVIDAQFGVFTPEAQGLLGREPKVPHGMSFNRLTQK